VLDLGCATGTTGAALKARQDVEVVGVEREPDYAREAATRWTGCSRPTSSSSTRPASGASTR
jgi:cyclopropane fatty-acyl-phospholipid synthase-like methyltransferase